MSGILFRLFDFGLVHHSMLKKLYGSLLCNLLHLGQVKEDCNRMSALPGQGVTKAVSNINRVIARDAEYSCQLLPRTS